MKITLKQKADLKLATEMNVNQMKIIINSIARKTETTVNEVIAQLKGKTKDIYEMNLHKLEK